MSKLPRPVFPILLTIVLSFTLLMAGCSSLFFDEARSDQKGKAPRAYRGVMNLTGISFDDRQTIPLSGEWEFYWNQLLEPADWTNRPPQASDQGVTPTPSGYSPVPGEWTDTHIIGGIPIPDRGYATYRLLLHLDPGQQIYGIRINNIRMAHRIYINGQLAGGMGVPGITHQEETIKNVPYPLFFSAPDETVELVIQVSDFFYRSGGIIEPISFGSASAITRQHQIFGILDLTTIAALIMTGISYLGIFLFRTKIKYLLYFACYCTFFAFYLTMHYDKILLQLLPDLDYVFAMQWKMVLMYLCFSGTSLFMNAIGEQYFSRRLLRVFLGLFCILILFSIVAPLDMVWTLDFLHYVPAAAQVLVIIATISKALIQKTHAGFSRASLIIILVGTIFLQISISLLFLSNAVLIQDRLLGFLFLLAFIICMTLFISKRNAEAYSAIEKLTESLMTADRMKDEFLIKTSHELKTPLHGILNLVRSVAEDERARIPEEQRQNLLYVESTAKRLSSIINDIIDFESIRSGRFRLATKLTDLASPIHTVTAALRPMFQEKGIRLDVQLGASQLLAQADEGRVCQILYNLMGNALKYTWSGQVRLVAKQWEGQILLTVEDTGVGIPEEGKKNIFDYWVHDVHVMEPYGMQAPEGEQQNDPKSSRGLGLPIARSLAELMGGRLWLESSEPGKGSKFCFTLPAAAENSSNPDPKRELMREKRVLEEAGRPATSVKHQILAVDDEISNIKVIRELFSGPEYEIIPAYNGAQALLELQKHKELSLVLLDLMLPDTSGLEVCQKIRREHSLLELPILLLTVRNGLEDIEAGLNAGANDFLSKPFDGRELRARADILLQMNQALKQVKQSELALLQAQVNPHFLYNTLNSIAALCRKQPWEAEQLTVEFANYLRGSFDFKDLEAWIPLHKEMEHILHYLTIEKVRYDDRIQVEMEIQEGLDPLIPPLILQPLVENAVQHGIAPLPGGGKIRVQIRKTPEGVTFLVEDSGVGMSQQKLETIRREETAGIGVWNIHRRLQSLFSAGLNIDSKEGGGTRVSFLLPDLK